RGGRGAEPGGERGAERGERGERGAERGERGERGTEKGERGERGAERGERGERGAERGERGAERGERGGGRAEARGAVSRLDTTRRTEFRQTIVRSGVRPLTGVNFALRAGVAVPRSVTLHALPPAILTLVPAYRGFQYVLVGDDIVIIDPDTYEIVDVIPA
ncbi:DUF1236 domain-containing protein, partial [uncultured Methylobacterium sp.]